VASAVPFGAESDDPGDLRRNSVRQSAGFLCRANAEFAIGGNSGSDWPLRGLGLRNAPMSRLSEAIGGGLPCQMENDIGANRTRQR
jgi:hypothetical protein